MKKNVWKSVPATERKRHKGWSGISRVERNEATGDLRFRTHVTYTDENGNKHQTETRICSTPQECLKEARRLTKQKKEEAETRTPKLSMTIRQIFQEHFLPSLKAKATRETTEATTGDINRYRNARALYDHYMPASVASVKAREITASTFGDWLAEINKSKLSGNSVRRYKTILVVFATFLRNQGYFTDSDIDIMIKQRMGAITIKSRAEGARTDRDCPSVDDILKIIDYYREAGLEKFKNLSWMVLWVVLFCSGVRVEELTALRVSSYDPARNTLTVDDAICDRERPDNVRQRVAAGVKRMKNNCSVREISILKFYEALLKAYLVRYEKYFGSRDGFLFPRLVPGNEDGWQTEKSILRELNRLKKRIDIPAGIDPQMFRHGTATFLIRDMDLSYDAVHAYFGHSSSEMLRKVYGTLNLAEKQERANTAMMSLLAGSAAEYIDPNKKRRQDVMMLAGDYAAWMDDLVSEVLEG